MLFFCYFLFVSCSCHFVANLLFVVVAVFFILERCFCRFVLFSPVFVFVCTRKVYVESQRDETINVFDMPCQLNLSLSDKLLQVRKQILSLPGAVQQL